MKYVLRNNLWMMIVAWCLMIKGYSFWGIVVALLSSIYLLPSIKRFNVLRCLIVFLGFMIYCYLLASVTVSSYYHNFTLFLLFNCLNVAITSEELQKERLSNLYNIFVFGLCSFVVFFLVTLFLPKYLITEIARINTLSLIMIIFMPYTSSMLINVIKKEYDKKRLLEKLERKTKDKMFDIKA